MKRSSRVMGAAGMLAAIVMALGTAGVQQAAAQGSNMALTPAQMAKADSGRPPFVAADVAFMSGMIGHHSQAIVMAKWAPSHGARPDVRILCERIVVAQRDEIFSMQRWLRERHLPVPAADTLYDPTAMGGLAGMKGMSGMSGMAGMAMMPGMLTLDQMKQLDAARGTEFDRLFLTFMIQHHQGALSMVETLFGSQGAAQDDVIFKFASDVSADQTAEIDRMGHMLDATPATGSE